MNEWGGPTDEPLDRPPRRTAGDRARQLWYTAFPTNYTDEDSSLSELLWQLVLEARSLRVVVVVVACAFLTPLVLSLGIVIGVLLTG